MTCLFLEILLHLIHVLLRIRGRQRLDQVLADAVDIPETDEEQDHRDHADAPLDDARDRPHPVAPIHVVQILGYPVELVLEALLRGSLREFLGCELVHGGDSTPRSVSQKLRRVPRVRLVTMLHRRRHGVHARRVPISSSSGGHN